MFVRALRPFLCFDGKKDSPIAHELPMRLEQLMPICKEKRVKLAIKAVNFDPANQGERIKTPVDIYADAASCWGEIKPPITYAPPVLHFLRPDHLPIGLVP